jgi:hypothetical protein
MAKLDLTSRSAFYHMKRKFPDAFVVVNPSTEKGNVAQYDKKAFDKFLQTLKTPK